MLTVLYMHVALNHLTRVCLGAAPSVMSRLGLPAGVYQQLRERLPRRNQEADVLLRGTRNRLPRPEGDVYSTTI